MAHIMLAITSNMASNKIEVGMFKNKRILVIGGSSGIGEATALRASEEGAIVTIASRTEERLQSALLRLPAGTLSSVLDVRDSLQVKDFFNKHKAWDHVILTGSATQVGSINSLPIDQAHEAMQSKFWGAYYVGKYAQINKGGSLTFVSGVYAQKPDVNAVLQGALNAGVEGLMRGLALELSPASVRVNAVSPSTTDTPLWNRLGEAGRAMKFSTMEKRLLTSKVAAAEDIAQAILYVSSNPSTTGSTILVDGGDALV